MNTLNQTDLNELLEASGERCISLYMPTHPIGREQQQNPVRLKNLVNEARKDLSAAGLRRPDVDKLLRPAEELLSDHDFWQHQGEGLAIFLSNEFSRIHRLPATFEELVVIASSFHIKPLLPLLSSDGKFYILALDLNGIRLFLGTRDTVNEVSMSGIRTGMQETLWMDDPERQLQWHSGGKSTGGAAGGPAIFHGQDIGNEEKTNILRFFQYFDRDLNSFLEDKNILMIPAGVDYLLPIYREANSYPNLLEKGITGATDNLSASELHKRAWQVIEPIFRERQDQAIEQFNELHGQQNGLATTDLEAAVKAAKFGRIGTLFVPLGVHRWGRYDPENNRVVEDGEAKPENEDLLDFAAMHTILNSGQVYALPEEDLPGEGDLAAILRYAA